MWLMLQEDEPEDFVIATGEMHSVREFVEASFQYVGIKIKWEGTGEEEVGVEEGKNIVRVKVNSKYYRPTEVVSGNFLYISTNFSNPEKDNFQVVNSGASEAIFDIKENIVSFDKKTDSVFNFKNISLRGLAKKEVFEGYKCNLFVTERGDTLYISNSLPYYVNPFFLNKESIKNGIVKATIVKVGTYSISGLMKNSGKPITGFKITEKTKINQVENIFFK